MVAVLAGQQCFRIHAVLHQIRCAPFACDCDVVSEVPGKVVPKLLRSALDFPSAQGFEGVMVQGQNSARPPAVRRAEGTNVDCIRAAMHRMQPAVPGPRCYFMRLDHLYDLRLAWVGFRIDDVDARGTQSGNDQVSSFHVRMRSVGAQSGTAGIPPEVMQLITPVRHVDPTHDLPIAFRTQLDINNHQGVSLGMAVSVQRGHVRQALRGSLAGKFRRRIKGWIGFQ